MCNNHHGLFNGFLFFIHFLPNVSLICLCFESCIHKKQIRKFVFISYSENPFLQNFHGRAIALDITDLHAPFPSLFIIHEMHVRGFHPFVPPNPVMPNDTAFQDWIRSEGLFNNNSLSFKCEHPPPNHSSSITVQPQLPPGTANTGSMSSGGCTLAFDADIVNNILAAMHAMLLWKACQIEGMSWTGTAGENTLTYISSIGV